MDWVGAFLDVGGKFFTARKQIIGWWIYLGSNVAWIIWSLEQEVWSLFSLEAVHGVLNVYAVYYWTNKGRLKIDG